MSVEIVPVNGPTPYQVYIGRALDGQVAQFLAESAVSKVAIVVQPSMVEPARALASHLEQAGLVATFIEIPDAEEAKSIETCARAWDHLGEQNFSRQDAIVGFGGGAATDLAGFIAATWMRGIKVVQVPTTLLAMVDAAVGGKTGINTSAGKNLVGSFHEPAAVFVDLERLATLPQEEIVAGSAEIIKTGFIHDPVIIERYLEDPQACLRADGHLPELIKRSVAVKASVVGQDLKESGLRETLNYGHTFGHAVELREHYQWRHGCAVAVGMMFIAHLSHLRGLISEELLGQHKLILESVGLPTSYEAGCFDQLYSGMTRDKKNKAGAIRFVALTGIGHTTRIVDATMEELRLAYERISG